MFITTVLTLAKLWNQPTCPTTDERTKKMWNIHNGVLLSHKEENGWNWRIITLSERSQSQKAKYCMFSLIHTI
jgi:hypothetical protein